MIATRMHGGDPDLGPPLCISAPANVWALSNSSLDKAQTSTRITAGSPSLTLQVALKPRLLPDRNKFASHPTRSSARLRPHLAWSAAPR